MSDISDEMVEAEAPTCGAIIPGNWPGSYLPACALPAPHPALDHWWHHGPTGNVHMWSDDGRYTHFVAGAGWVDAHA